MHNGGADVVMLNPTKALVSQAQPNVAEELAKRGIEPQMVNIERATQLLNKTNQMNLTTRRMTAGELMAWARQNNHVLWTFRVADRFGESL